MKSTVNGIEVNYEVEGAGPWVVLSHSLGCNLRMWDPQVRALSGQWQVLRYDTRGHGGSAAPAGHYTLGLLAADLQALLSHLDIVRPHFVGLSMGGMIGMTAEVAHPGLFASLTLCDTTSRIPAEAAPVWAERMRIARAQGMDALVEPTLKRWFTEPFLARQDPAVATVAEMIRTTPVDGYVGCCGAIAGIDLTGRLGEIACPVQIIVGQQDVGTPVAMSQAIHDAIPGSSLAVLAQASHISNLEQAGAFDAALTGFLRQAGAA